MQRGARLVANDTHSTTPNLPEARPAYLEPLPAGCPPNDSLYIDEELQVYRFLEATTPTHHDFTSHWVRFPQRKYRDECTARAISVFDSLDEGRMTKGATLVMRQKTASIVTLRSGAGRISPPAPRDSHRDLWLFKDYPVLECCQVI